MGTQAPDGGDVVPIRALIASVVPAGVSAVQVIARHEVVVTPELNTREMKVPGVGWLSTWSQSTETAGRPRVKSEAAMRIGPATAVACVCRSTLST